MVEVPLTESFEYDVDAFVDAVSRHAPHLVFLCSPNNPTGTALSMDGIRRIVASAPGLVVLDEAYWEFSGEKTRASRRVREPADLPHVLQSARHGRAPCWLRAAAARFASPDRQSTATVSTEPDIARGRSRRSLPLRFGARALGGDCDNARRARRAPRAASGHRRHSVENELSSLTRERR